ncbi:cadherin-like domain-containing protein [Vibrio chagasii]|nr:cadherin-like domain-containing protein [Vibrio chagasii]
MTHTENFNGELDFTYSISDGENEVPVHTNLTVNPVNDAPGSGVKRSRPSTRRSNSWCNAS